MGRVLRSVKNWQLFRDAPVDRPRYGGGTQVSHRAARTPASSRMTSDASIMTAIYVRMAVDLSSVEFYHAKLDKDHDVAVEVVRDELHNCLTLSPNIDQHAQQLKMDAAMTMFMHGHCAIVPIDCEGDPTTGDAFKVNEMRVGRVVWWGTRDVTVEVYDDRQEDLSGNPVNSGIVKQMTLPKHMVAIVENPFVDIMNNPSGQFQRLIRKYAILDAIDEAAGSGKLDLIFQLPYAVRGPSRKQQAEDRRAALAEQLKDDELGIGYIDVSEKVIQLNRPVVNTLPEQIRDLLAAVKTEMGITDEIMNGTAPLTAIGAYMDRTIEPIANAMALEMKRKFFSKTSISQRHSIEIYRDPLKLIPIDQLAEVADKLRRSGVVTANEFRPKIGYMPSSDPTANTLGNPNMPEKDQAGTDVKPEEEGDDGLPEQAA